MWMRNHWLMAMMWSLQVIGLTVDPLTIKERNSFIPFMGKKLFFLKQWGQILFLNMHIQDLPMQDWRYQRIIM